MTDTMLYLYLLLQLDSIREFIGVLQFISIFLTIVIAVILGISIAVEERIDKARPYFKYVVGLMLASTFFGFVNTAIPTTERAALMIVGAKVIDSNTTTILTHIPEKYAKVLEAKAQAYMDETLKTTKPVK